MKSGVDALRTVRTSLLDLAYDVAGADETQAALVLLDPGIREERLREEWARVERVLRPSVLKALVICIPVDGGFRGIPRDPSKAILKAIAKAMEAPAATPTAKVDYGFVVRKLLFHQWFASSEPVTTEWLQKVAGVSYRTVARALREMGSLVERMHDRRVRLRHFDRETFNKLVAGAERARSTVRFVDRSGQPRAAEAHLRRLEKLRPKRVGVGGVIGAMHYLPALDLTGAPRLDLSVRAHGVPLDTSFVQQLDPGLRIETDPLAPVSVVVHAVRHSQGLFTQRDAGLNWVDPVECVFDLFEARLDVQANQLLEALVAHNVQMPGPRFDVR